jgi:hypothetical protein
VAYNKVSFAITLLFALIACNGAEESEPKRLGKLLSPDRSKEIIIKAFAQNGISNAFVGIDLHTLKNGKSEFEERILSTMACKNLDVRWLNDNTVGLYFDEIDSGETEMTRTAQLEHVNVVDMRLVSAKNQKLGSIGVENCFSALGITGGTAAEKMPSRP